MVGCYMRGGGRKSKELGGRALILIATERMGALRAKKTNRLKSATIKPTWQTGWIEWPHHMLHATRHGFSQLYIHQPNKRMPIRTCSRHTEALTAKDIRQRDAHHGSQLMQIPNASCRRF